MQGARGLYVRHNCSDPAHLKGLTRQTLGWRGLGFADAAERTCKDAAGGRNSPASNVDQDLLIKALSGQGDASTMRQILLQGGANADEVKLLSDSDLMDMYNSVLSAQNPTVATSTATSTAASSTNQ